MKKIILISFLLVISTFGHANAALDGLSLKSLRPSYAVQSGSTYSLPGLLQGVKNGIPAMKWAQLRITPAIGKAVVGRMAMMTGIGAVAMFGPQLIGYLADKGFDYLEGQFKQKHVTHIYEVVNPEITNQMLSGVSTNPAQFKTPIVIYYPNYQEYAANMLAAPYTGGGGITITDSSKFSGWGYVGVYNPNMSSPKDTALRVYPTSPGQVIDQEVVSYTPATQAQIEAAVLPDLNNQNQNAQKLLAGAVAQVAKWGANGDNFSNAYGDDVTVVNNTIVQSADASTIADIEVLTDSVTAADDYAESAGEKDDPIINDNVTETPDVSAPPYTGGSALTMGAAAIPDVGDFAGLFSSFLTTMQGTPLFSLPGLLSSSVPSGGSCSMSVDMSERFGGSQTVSICNWDTGLSYLKAVLLCIASIFAVGIVAKGGGA